VLDIGGEDLEPANDILRFDEDEAKRKMRNDED
jgi:hypothetical protein